MSRVLAPVQPGSRIPDSDDLEELLSWLEGFVQAALPLACGAATILDGIVPESATKHKSSTAKILGRCWVLGSRGDVQQPIYLSIRAHADLDRIKRLECRFGVSGNSNPSDKVLNSLLLPDAIHRIAWACEFTVDG